MPRLLRHGAIGLAPNERAQLWITGRVMGGLAGTEAGCRGEDPGMAFWVDKVNGLRVDSVWPT